MSEDITKRISELKPDVRSRVEKALKDTLERELATTAVTEEERAAVRDFERSSSPWHDRNHERERPTVEPPTVVEQIRQIPGMSDEAFAKFSQRLTELKKIRSPPET